MEADTHTCECVMRVRDREAVPQKVLIVLFISADLSGPREANQYRKDLGCCVWQVLINYGAVVLFF